MVIFLFKIIHWIKLYEKLLVNIIETLNLELESFTLQTKQMFVEHLHGTQMTRLQTDPGFPRLL